MILSLLSLFSPDLMRMIFSRVQSCLRKHVNRKTAPESRLRQFMSTSIHSVGNSTEVIVQMERASDVSVQVRGPRSEDRQCFFLLEEVLGVIDQVGFKLVYFSPNSDEVPLSCAWFPGSA